MDTTDDKTMFLGLVAVDCLSTDENIVVKTKGYFPIANTTLTGVTAGDKVGIVNGQLAKVTDANQAIAVIVSGAWMKLL
jgi:hypothetical protein